MHRGEWGAVTHTESQIRKPRAPEVAHLTPKPAPDDRYPSFKTDKIMIVLGTHPNALTGTRPALRPGGRLGEQACGRHAAPSR